MATVTIRNLDDEVVTRLKQRAQENGRSLEAELRHILTHETLPHSPLEAVAVARAIAAMTPTAPQQSDSTKLIREDRNR